MNFASGHRQEDRLQEETEPVFSVTDYLLLVKNKIDNLYVNIQGEISEFSAWGSGAFLTLQDKETKDIMKCFIYNDTIHKSDILPEEGAEVKISGKPWINKKRGELSFTITSISPIGEGALRQAYLARKKRLEEKGYFDESTKKLIPKYISKIALLTSKSGDGKVDFIEQLGNYGFKIFFKSVRVEGLAATESVVEGIEFFNKSNLTLDLIVITRGGGGFESLQAFDSEEIALAIHSSRIPIMTAIGHRQDVTIAQLVADKAANTPTDAAKIIRTPWDEAKNEIISYRKNIFSSFRKKVIDYENNLNNLWKSNVNLFKFKILSNKKNLREMNKSIRNSFKFFIKNRQNVFTQFKTSFILFRKELKRNHRVIFEESDLLRADSKKWLVNVKRRIEEEKNKLETSNPLKRLEQGYSIVYNNQKKVIKSADTIRKDEIITIRFNKGRVLSRVEEKI